MIESRKEIATAPSRLHEAEKQIASTDFNITEQSLGSFRPKFVTEQQQIATRNNLPDLLATKVTRYLAFNEVDTGAQPASDWVLRLDELSPNLQVTIQLTIYVDDEGYLDRFEIINTSIGETATYSLLRELQSTIFTPARKDGIPVANMRKIEITADSSAMPYGIRRFFKNFEAK